MDKDSILILTSSGIFFITLAIMYLIKRIRIAEDALSAKEVSMQEIITRLAVEEEKNKLQKQEFEIMVTPYQISKKFNLGFYRKNRIEYGYEYRLFIKGIPCLEPARIRIDETDEAEINSESIIKHVKKAVLGTAGEGYIKVLNFITDKTTRKISKETI